jgi:uncharacterized protein
MRCRFRFVARHVESMRRRTLLIPLVVVLATSECQHVASEESLPTTASPLGSSAPPPAPARAVERAPAASSPSDALPFEGRCVLPTPDLAPAPVPPGPAEGCPPDPEGELKALPVVRVQVARPQGPSVDAELVRSRHDTSRGLMYRKTLGDDRGMLFDLRARENHTFWMHNTCIPLDLIFIDFDGLIVGIVENAPTLNDASRSVGCPSRWVLEVNAGWSRRHGVRAGERIELPEAARVSD